MKKSAKKKPNTQVQINNGTYCISERELLRYFEHGMARVRFDKMVPQPNGMGRISLEPLTDCSGNNESAAKKPMGAWVQRGEKPTIIISSGAKNEGTRFGVRFDDAKKVTALSFMQRFKGADRSIKLEPIYS